MSTVPGASAESSLQREQTDATLFGADNHTAAIPLTVRLRRVPFAPEQLLSSLLPTLPTLVWTQVLFVPAIYQLIFGTVIVLS